MPRTSKYEAKHLNSWNARKKLPVQNNPYYMHLEGPLSVGYRRSNEQGTWMARALADNGKYRWAALGAAQDAVESVGFDFEQAKTKAREWHRKQMAFDAGEIDNSRQTVGDALDKYLEHLKRTKPTDPATTRASIDAHIRPKFGAVPLTRLRHSQLIAWRDALASSPARVRSKAEGKPAHRVAVEDDGDAMRRRRATVNRILTILKAALNYAHEELRWIDSKQAWEAVKPYRNVDVPKVRFLTAEEVTSLLHACAPDFRLLVQAALATGMRYGELTRLTVEDVNLTDGAVYVSKSKNGEARWVDLNAEGTSLFEALTRGLKPADRVFSKANGTAWGKSEQKRPMDAACLAAKVSGVTFHILRHTHASHALMGGMPLEVLQKQLGHKDLRITMRHYAHLCDRFKRDAVRRTGPVFGFQPTELGPRLVLNVG